MSRIDDLLAELAPNGVEFKPVGEIASYSSTRVDSGDLDATSFVGVDNLLPDKAGKVDATHRPNTARLTAFEPGDLLLGNIRPYLKKVWLASHAGGCSGDVLALRLDPEARAILLPEFFYYLLSSDEFFSYSMKHAKGAKMPRGDKAAILKFRIPLPPVPVQHEVVRVLDQFTELQAELEAELEARWKQYEYYRDSLLTFPEGGRAFAMGDIGTIFGGLVGKSKADFGDGHARFVSFRNIFNNMATDLGVDDFVNVRAGERQRALEKGDVLFTASSESPDELGMSSVVTEAPSEPLYLNSFSVGFRLQDQSILDPEFAKHLFRSWGMRKQMIRTGMGVTRINLSKKRLAAVVVPSPPWTEQRRIAAILDKFYLLSSDLSTGLPAELAARRKQYEYYRNRLLTFEEATT